ncbi:MAG: integrase arm-type DNA-binding domain-containing protein [Desulfovibrio sp.]|nr:integrase arm-type DNA-binding domain-containing protein [Desulfovibrio sp.]
MNKLTDTFLRSVKPTGKVQKHFDGGGLFIHVTATGSPSAGGMLWRMVYRFDGKQKLLSFGAYPAVSLKDARTRREEAKEQLAKSIDPSAHKQAVKAAAKAETENTFEIIAREWWSKHKDTWAPSHAESLLGRLTYNVFTPLGARGIKDITPLELLAVLRRTEERGAVHVAHRVLQICSQVFRYAIATGRAERDITADLRGALPPVKKRNFPSITEPSAISNLLRSIDAYNGSFIVRSALTLAPYVFVRPGELRHAEWAEIDMDNAEWRIPANKMKMRQLHIVPLARQVLDILIELHKYTGMGKYLFPGMRTSVRPISDSTLLNALRSMGYDRETLVVHGFRGMASTLLNEQGYNRDWIERQLAHGERDAVRAAYNYAQYLPERRRMMQQWADYLDSLRSGKAAVDTSRPVPIPDNPSFVVRRGGKVM